MHWHANAITHHMLATVAHPGEGHAVAGNALDVWIALEGQLHRHDGSISMGVLGTISRGVVLGATPLLATAGAPRCLPRKQTIRCRGP